MPDDFPVHHVDLGRDGPIGALPAGVTWDSETRTVALCGDEPGHLHVIGSGEGNAARSGSGDGNVRREGDGNGASSSCFVDYVLVGCRLL